MEKIKIHRNLSVISDNELHLLFSRTQKNLLRSKGKRYNQRRKILKKLETAIQKEIRNRPHLIVQSRPDLEIDFDIPNPFKWLGTFLSKTRHFLQNAFRNPHYH